MPERERERENREREEREEREERARGEKRKAPTTERVEAEFFTQLAIRGTCSKYTSRCRRK
jgi:hypothetical protein